MFGCTKYTGRSTGTHVDDTVIAAEISAHFLREKNLKSGAINVDCTNGLVTLSGVVETKEQEIIAKHIAGKVKGVRKVVSTLQIKKDE